MKRALWALLAILAATLAVPGSLRADVPINEHREVSSDALIEVSVVAGTVQITGWDKPQVDLSGSLSDDRQKLEITGGKDRLKIAVHMPEDEHHYTGESDLVLKVPRGCGVSVENVSGTITITDLTARVQLNSVSGNLVVKGSPREAKLNTVSGEIRLDDGNSLESAEANSVSGPIHAHVRFRSGGSFHFETVSGPITLRLPGSASADFSVSTFSGSITSDFGEKPEKTSQFLPSEELEFSVGSGGARVKVNSFSGPIKILKD